MCVICHAAKKRHIRREEVKEAMDRNNSGFFMAALHPQGGREIIRTLSQTELLKFFDETVKDDDAVVLHARIPSYGGGGLQNVHGWEEDGILFSHNMSVRAIDGYRDKFPDWKDRTDSEFFFKKMFIPYYRGLGDEAYKDGKLHPDLHKYVEWICGSSNKFCFIMPDNKVLRFGEWVNESDRRENGECAFYASNSTYKCVSKPFSVIGRSGEDDAVAEYYRGMGYGAIEDARRVSAGTYQFGNKKTIEYNGEELCKQLLPSDMCKIAFTDFVMQNLVESRILDVPKSELGVYEKRLRRLLPEAFTGDTFRLHNLWIPKLTDEKAVKQYLSRCYAAYERELVTGGGASAVYPTQWTVSQALRNLKVDIDTARKILNVDFKFDAKSPTAVATAYVIDVSRKGNPTMRKFEPIDLICPDEQKFEDACKCLGVFFQAMRDYRETEAKAKGVQA